MTTNATSKTMLKVKRVAIDTYHENVAFLHRNCEIYRAEGFQALSKISIMANGTRIHAVLNVVDDEHIVAPGELGLAEQAFMQLDMEETHLVCVEHAEPPGSMDAVRRKINGERLTQDDFKYITHDISITVIQKWKWPPFLSPAHKVV